MEIVIERVGGEPGPITLEEFADKHELVMEVHERAKLISANNTRWYAHFRHTHVKQCGGGYLGTCGDGKTPEEAISDYGNRIAGQSIAVNVWSSTEPRKDIQCPNEWAERPGNK